MAWLPIPPGDKPHYELSATKGGETANASLTVAVRPPPMPLPDTGKLQVDRVSVLPAGRLALRPDERVRVSIRAPANARVALHTGDGTTHQLAHANGVLWLAEVPARDLTHGGTVVVHRNGDSVDVKIASVTLVDAAAPRYVDLLNANLDARSDTDQVAILRPSPEGTYKWFLFPGTTVEVTGQRDNYLRVRLDDQLEAWVEERATRPAPDATVSPRRTAGNARVAAGDGYSDLRIPVTQRSPYLVEEVSPNQLRLTLYGVTSNVDIVNFATNDPTIRDVTWEQVTSDRVRFTVELRHDPYGYLALWDRGSFVLRVRRPPAVNPDRPLAGRVIALDPGHPPIGSTGPTGLYEGDAVLEIAQQLKPMLESRGATVVMTRTTRDPVPLGDRTIIARRANADAFVSIHLNALPDGANPARANGSGTYFFLPQAEPLARSVQRGLVRYMQLRDLGVNYDNLAVARFTWAPSILCEGAFVIDPTQESALRSPDFQRKYAQGILDGLEEFFRGLPRQ
jgi:N-acetylmuramoyl-L-alanine amidase